MEANNSVSVNLSGVSEVSTQLNTLATNIESTLAEINKTVSAVGEGAINGDAPDALVSAYLTLEQTLKTYPARLADMANSLSKSGDIYEAVDTAAVAATNN